LPVAAGQDRMLVGRRTLS